MDLTPAYTLLKFIKKILKLLKHTYHGPNTIEFEPFIITPHFGLHTNSTFYARGSKQCLNATIQPFQR